MSVRQACKERKTSLDTVRKTHMIAGLLADQQQKLSPISLNTLQRVSLDAVVFLLTKAQPPMSLRGLGDSLSSVTAVLKDELQSIPADRKDSAWMISLVVVVSCLSTH